MKFKFIFSLLHYLLNLTWVNNIKNTNDLFDVRGNSLKNYLTNSVHQVCRAGLEKREEDMKCPISEKTKIKL